MSDGIHVMIIPSISFVLIVKLCFSVVNRRIQLILTLCQFEITWNEFEIRFSSNFVASFCWLCFCIQFLFPARLLFQTFLHFSDAHWKRKKSISHSFTMHVPTFVHISNPFEVWVQPLSLILSFVSFSYQKYIFTSQQNSTLWCGNNSYPHGRKTENLMRPTPMWSQTKEQKLD